MFIRTILSMKLTKSWMPKRENRLRFFLRSEKLLLAILAYFISFNVKLDYVLRFIEWQKRLYF
jgi:hypothetical protein